MRFRVIYYREPDGDHLAVWYARRMPDGSGIPGGVFAVRAAAIAGVPSSVCTCGASRDYLRNCRPVRRSAVPANWLQGINPEVSRG